MDGGGLWPHAPTRTKQWRTPVLKATRDIKRKTGRVVFFVEIVDRGGFVGGGMGWWGGWGVPA